MRIALICSLVRQEERYLYEALRDAGAEVAIIDDRSPVLSPDRPEPWSSYNAILLRSLSYWKSLHFACFFQTIGIPVFNSLPLLITCGNKFFTTMRLHAAGIPVPVTHLALSAESALETIETMGYPVVIKSTLGSWGRLLARIHHRDAAEAILEHREMLGSFFHHVHYLQEHIEKPGRDIRAVVIGDRVITAIYRTSKHWITNTARGGEAQICPLTPELEAICLETARALGPGILAIDLLEDPERGFLVNEVNHTMEFRNVRRVTGIPIERYIVQYVIEKAMERTGVESSSLNGGTPCTG